MLFLHLNKLFFESFINVEHDGSYANVIIPQLPEGWEARQGGVWLGVSSPCHTYPEHGFKIHVSGTPSTSVDIVKRAAAVCIAHNVPFKTARDPRMLEAMSSKHYPRGSAGKLMTAYPPDQAGFVRLIKDLHEELISFNGPYILSDRRFGDRGVVYYRYGEFLSLGRIESDGSTSPEILGPNGERYQENRLPYYTLPPWVEDPFGNEPVSEYQGDHLLNDRYEINHALSFSNAGGVYLATDRWNDTKVVLKEGRPHAAEFRGLDAVAMVEHEFNVLSRLEGVTGVIQPVELFRQWEHCYLVEEYFEGVRLTQFRARNDFFLWPFDGAENTVVRFCRKFSVIATQLIIAIRLIHERGVIIADVSPNNILIDPETLKIRFIDFESAYIVGQDLPEAFSANWHTPGFADNRRMSSNRLVQADDWFGLGMVLFSTILPVQELFDLERGRLDPFLGSLCQAAGLPSCIASAIRCLLSGDDATALAELAKLDVNLELPCPSLSRVALDAADLTLDQLVTGTDAFLKYMCQPSRRDRLWPSDPESFRTNPLSLAFGAAGPLFYEAVRGAKLADSQRAWIENAISQNKSLPPGLYTGLAGLAVAFAEHNELGRAIELLARAMQSPLIGNDATVFQGDAGVLLACLLIHEKTGNPTLMQWASDISDGILSATNEDEHGLFWPSRRSMDRRELGFAYGNSGIALSLLYVGMLTQNHDTVAFAKRALEAEISSATIRDGVHYWGQHVGSNIEEPYWLHGSSGVGTALIRFAVLLNDSRFMDLAIGAADQCFSRFTALPGQFEGMSGIGEFMLDMYQYTGNSLFLDRANMLCESISCYRVEGERSVAFPGRGLLRLSCDYAYGSSGVGLFLNRLLIGGERKIHDLHSLRGRMVVSSLAV